jgi:putative transcriptional regulator
MDSLAGHFLIASRQLRDPNFLETVVLMLQHSEEGALGVVINRKSTATVRHVWKQVREEECASTETLFVGGPCPGPLMAVHAEVLLSNNEFLPGAYFTTDSDELTQLVEKTDIQVRFFVNYAGWSGGQLEGELNEGSWIVLPATVELIFSDPDDLWTRLIRQANSNALLAALKIRGVPKDPSLN